MEIRIEGKSKQEVVHATILERSTEGMLRAKVVRSANNESLFESSWFLDAEHMRAEIHQQMWRAGTLGGFVMSVHDATTRVADSSDGENS